MKYLLSRLFQLLISIVALLAIGAGSLFLFLINNDWEYLWGNTCIGELLCMLSGGLVAFIIVQHFNTKGATLTKKQTMLLLALNYPALLTALYTYVKGYDNLGLCLLFSFTHLITGLFIMHNVKQTIHFVALYGYMLFCSPIFYRIKTLAAEAPPSWDGEALGVANIQPIVSILVLGCIGLIILIGQSVKHTNSPITQKREPIS